MTIRSRFKIKYLGVIGFAATLSVQNFWVRWHRGCPVSWCWIFHRLKSQLGIRPKSGEGTGLRHVTVYCSLRYVVGLGRLPRVRSWCRFLQVHKVVYTATSITAPHGISVLSDPVPPYIGFTRQTMVSLSRYRTRHQGLPCQVFTASCFLQLFFLVHVTGSRSLWTPGSRLHGQTTSQPSMRHLMPVFHPTSTSTNSRHLLYELQIDVGAILRQGFLNLMTCKSGKGIAWKGSSPTWRRDIRSIRPLFSMRR